MCKLRLKGVLCFGLKLLAKPSCFVTGGAHEIIDLASCSSPPPSTPTLPLYLCVQAEYKCEAAREALLRLWWMRGHGTFIRMYILLSTSAISNAIPFTSTNCDVFKKQREVHEYTTDTPHVHRRSTKSVCFYRPAKDTDVRDPPHVLRSPASGRRKPARASRRPWRFCSPRPPAHAHAERAFRIDHEHSTSPEIYGGYTMHALKTPRAAVPETPNCAGWRCGLSP